MEQRPSFDPVELVGPLTLALLTAIVLGTSAAMIALGQRGGAEGETKAAPAGTTTPEAEATPTPAPPLSPEEAAVLAQQGQSLSQRFGCTGCHSTDGSRLTGPTWMGLFGSEVTLSDGSTITVDEAYVHESILDPPKKVVQGFSPVMPIFKDRLHDNDIRALTEWIKSLQ